MNPFLDGLAIVIAFVPKLLLAVVILVVGVILARLISRALARLLQRVGFDRLVERGGVAKALQQSGIDAAGLVARIVYYALVLFVLEFAFGVFGPNPISTLLATIIGYLPQVIVAIVIVIITAAIAAGAKSVIQTLLGGVSYGRVVANIASIGILFLGVIAALNQLGVAVTVTVPVLITVLATIGGILVVGVGGGLIEPMQSRWETYLSRAEAELPKARAAADTAPSVAEQVTAQARTARSRARTPRGTPTAQPATEPATQPASRPARQSAPRSATRTSTRSTPRSTPSAPAVPPAPDADAVPDDGSTL